MPIKRAISVVGCHAEGEVGDVITGGVLPPPGNTMFEKMQHMERHQDQYRKLLLCEPRGSVARHVNLLVPATRPDCDIGAIIMEPTEYVPMSGSNTICIVTVLLETGIIEMKEPETVVRLDMPGGVVVATAQCRNGKCVSVEFANVPAFVAAADAKITVEGFGEIRVDVVYGGMFFAIVDAASLGFAVAPEEAREIAALAEKIRLACRQQLEIVHPLNPEIRGVSIVQFAAPFAGKGNVSRNTCMVAPGRADRSPCGTGTSARMALLHAKGLMQKGDFFLSESIIGSRFKGRILDTADVNGTPAILPAIEGRAWITGYHHYVLDHQDPYPEGYVVADTWGITGSITQ